MVYVRLINGLHTQCLTSLEKTKWIKSNSEENTTKGVVPSKSLSDLGYKFHRFQNAYQCGVWLHCAWIHLAQQFFKTVRHITLHVEEIIVHVKEEVLRWSQVNALATMFQKNSAQGNVHFRWSLLPQGYLRTSDVAKGTSDSLSGRLGGCM